MAASTLSETATGTYIDGTGDTVLVFTDEDGKTKSLILQENYSQNFGRLAHTYDGYYERDYAPYTPVRLFLPNIKRPDQPTYTIEEIERNGEHDGAWIGDQGTLIIHRSDGNPPDRILHVMFSYDIHNELKLVRYGFSPISSSVAKTETFRHIMDDEHLTAVPAASNEADMSDHTPDTFHDKLDDIQKHIDDMKEQVSNALNIAKTAEDTIDIIASRVSTLEEKNKTTSNARNTPDSEGFWKDKDGDIWVHDGNPDHDALLLFDTACKTFYNLPKDNPSFWSHPEEYGPFVKLDNPFIQGGDNAE